jgi:hypothetical protein
MPGNIHLVQLHSKNIHTDQNPLLTGVHLCLVRIHLFSTGFGFHSFLTGIHLFLHSINFDQYDLTVLHTKFSSICSSLHFTSQNSSSPMRVYGFLDFIHCSLFYKVENIKFWKLDPFPYSGDRRDTFTLFSDSY